MPVGDHLTDFAHAGLAQISGAEPFFEWFVFEHGNPPRTPAVLYTDEDMGTQAGNSFQTNNLGSGSFYAAPGLYDLIPVVTPPGQNYFPTTVLVPVNPLDAGSGGGVGQVLSLTYWDGSEQSAPFDVPCFGVPADYSPSVGCMLGAVLTIGSGGITSGVLLDANSEAIPDGWTFIATIMVFENTIVDIFAVSALSNQISGGILYWGFEGGPPGPLFLPGSLVAGGVVTPFFELDGVIWSVYAGDPNGNVTSSQKGDVIVDTATPAIWQAAAAESTDWLQVGGGGSGPEISVNSEDPVSSGLVPLQITKQPVVPPSGILQPLPPLFGFVFSGTIVTISVNLNGGATKPCAARDGNTWVAGNDQNVNRITPGGVVTSFALGETADPIGACSGPDGNVWVTDGSHSAPGIWRVLLDGTPTFFALAGSSPNYVCAGADGNLWVSDSESGHGGVWQVTTEGVGTFFAIAGSGIYDVCAGPDGNIYATDLEHSVIQKITPEGVVTDIPVAFAAGSGFGICVGPDANLWATDGDGFVWRVTLDGVATQFALEGSNPLGVSSGAGGDVWVADRNNALWKVTMEGETTSFALPEGGDWLCSGNDGGLWITSPNDVFVAPFTVVLGGLNIVDGILFANNIPTADPHIVGQVWNHSGVLTVSAG